MGLATYKNYLNRESENIIMQIIPHSIPITYGGGGGGGHGPVIRLFIAGIAILFYKEITNKNRLR